jgi:hypothetical protein
MNTVVRWYLTCLCNVSRSAPEIAVVMAWHVKVDNLPWCRTPYARRQDLRIVAHDDSVAFMCSHTHIAHAARMVEWLRQFGIGRARLVDGMCEEAHGGSDDPSENLANR